MGAGANKSEMPATESGTFRPIKAQEDLALVQRVLTGDPEARSELFARMLCLPRFARYLNRKKGALLSPEELADAIQEAYKDSWQELPGFGGRGGFEAWCFAITSSAIVSAMRRKDRHARVILMSHSVLESLQLKIADRDDGLTPRELRALEVFDRLPEHLRELIIGFAVDKIPFAVLAERQGTTAAALRSRYYRAIEDVRIEIPDEREKTMGAGA